MTVKQQLKAKWKQYLADNPKWKRTINQHHYIRCRYASKFWLKEVEGILGEDDKNPTYYDIVVHSPQFQAWIQYQESKDIPDFDIAESVECDWLSQRHFQAFLKYAQTFKDLADNDKKE